MRFDGATWKQHNSGQGMGLRDVWGTSSSDILAVGDSGVAYHHDGVTWSPTVTNTMADLKGVWGPDATSYLAVGAGGVMVRRDGKAWSRVKLDLREASSAAYSCPDLLGVHGTAKGATFVVGSGETVLRYCPKGQCP